MLFLRDAVSTWADRNISDWNGAEKDARRSMGPPQRPWLWKKDRNPDKCLIYDGNDDEQFVSEAEAEKWWAETELSLIKEWEAELQASTRWADAVNKFRNFLASGDLVGQILTDSGALFGIRKERWRAKDAGQFFSDGFAKGEKPVGKSSVFGIDGAIVIDRSAIQDIIDKKNLPGQSQPKNPKSSIDENRSPPSRDDVLRHSFENVRDQVEREWPDKNRRPNIGQMATQLATREDVKFKAETLRQIITGNYNPAFNLNKRDSDFCYPFW